MRRNSQGQATSGAQCCIELPCLWLDNAASSSGTRGSRYGSSFETASSTKTETGRVDVFCQYGRFLSTVMKASNLAAASEVLAVLGARYGRTIPTASAAALTSLGQLIIPGSLPLAIPNK